MPEGKRNETLETHIGIVGTEAKINQEELVKSRRKIWSIPIALAVVLMLVALAGMSVLAQGSRPSAANAIGAFNASADTLITVPITEVVITNLPLTDADAPNWTALPVVPENTDTEATELVGSPAIIGGPKYDQDGSNGNPATDVFAVPGTITESETTAAGMYTIPITLATGIVAANIDAALPRDSYTFQVRLVIDTNNAADGAADDDEDTENDRDLTLTARVTINVMRG